MTTRVFLDGVEVDHSKLRFNSDNSVTIDGIDIDDGSILTVNYDVTYGESGTFTHGPHWTSVGARPERLFGQIWRTGSGEARMRVSKNRWLVLEGDEVMVGSISHTLDVPPGWERVE